MSRARAAACSWRPRPRPARCACWPGTSLLASNELTQRGWHAFDSLATAPVAPTADFSASPRSGAAPLLVRFTDLSTGAPTNWLWDFGDGTTASAAEPDHVYGQPGA